MAFSALIVQRLAETQSQFTRAQMLQTAHALSQVIELELNRAESALKVLLRAPAVTRGDIARNAAYFDYFIAMLPTNLTAQLQQLGDALERADTASATAAAHSLQGTASLMGCAQLAREARAFQHAPAQSALVEVEAALIRAVEGIRSWASRSLPVAESAGR